MFNNHLYFELYSIILISEKYFIIFQEQQFQELLASEKRSQKKTVRTYSRNVKDDLSLSTTPNSKYYKERGLVSTDNIFA